MAGNVAIVCRKSSSRLEFYSGNLLFGTARSALFILPQSVAPTASNATPPGPTKASSSTPWPPAAPIKASTYPANGPKRVQVQIPPGLTVGASYRVRLEARLSDDSELRHFTWSVPVTAA